jgi:hypothetical protein
MIMSESLCFHLGCSATAVAMMRCCGGLTAVSSIAHGKEVTKKPEVPVCLYEQECAPGYSTASMKRFDWGSARGGAKAAGPARSQLRARAPGAVISLQPNSPPLPSSSCHAQHTMT